VTASYPTLRLQSTRHGQTIVAGLALLAFMDGLMVGPAAVQGVVAAVLVLAAGGIGHAVIEPVPPGEDQVETTLAEMNQMNAELMLLRDQAESYALTDQLTGVGNRRAFDEALEQWIAKPPQPGRTLAVMLIDIDHFKAVNDSHGHARGDAARASWRRVCCRGLGPTT
jgi:predicted signal transduction protein with EAL and GGDEF domain